MINFFLVLLGKNISNFSELFNLGSGSTWPGHIALSINPHFIQDILKKNKTKVILIAGTNGKTTTAKLIQIILEKDGKKVFRNESGANLLNGIASSMLLRSSILCKLNFDFAIFEMDENNLPDAISATNPSTILLLDLFRDQLDRYGEIDSIVKKWKDSLQKLDSKTILILNADDPEVAFIGKNLNTNTFYFGLDDAKIAKTSLQHAVDSIYCPNCGEKLTFKKVYLSHLGDWECPNCKEKKPQIFLEKAPFYPLNGVYNRYNTHAALLAARTLQIPDSTINDALKDFKPAFGRQEKLTIESKKVQIFLSKNPTSFNESLRTINELACPQRQQAGLLGGRGAKNLLIVLNNRIPDGRDVSWIWDADVEGLDDNLNITISGDRAYDMGLRLKYSQEDQRSKTKLKV